jgi:RNA polymerase sigma-70 factor (ECF subfamily)
MLNGPDSLTSELTWNDSLLDELRRFLTKRLKCPEAAADLTHETYLRLQQRDSANPPENARALAFHIAMNLAVDYQRKAAVRNRFMVVDEIDSITETSAATSGNPEQTLIAHQRLEILQGALDELPADCRTVFLLHGVEGLKYSEIAERLGISLSMVGKHLSRAMNHCAQRIDA